MSSPIAAPVRAPADTVLASVAESLLAAGADLRRAIDLAGVDVLPRDWAPDEVDGLTGVWKQLEEVRRQLNATTEMAVAGRSELESRWAAYCDAVAHRPQPHPVTTDADIAAQIVDMVRDKGTTITGKYLLSNGMGPKDPRWMDWRVELQPDQAVPEVLRPMWIPTLRSDPPPAPDGDVIARPMLAEPREPGDPVPAERLLPEQHVVELTTGLVCSPLDSQGRRTYPVDGYTGTVYLDASLRLTRPADATADSLETLVADAHQPDIGPTELAKRAVEFEGINPPNNHETWLMWLAPHPYEFDAQIPVWFNPDRARTITHLARRAAAWCPHADTMTVHGGPGTDEIWIELPTGEHVDAETPAPHTICDHNPTAKAIAHDANDTHHSTAHDGDDGDQ